MKTKKKPQRLYSAVIKMNIKVFTSFNKIIDFLVLLSSMRNTKRRDDRKFAAANIHIRTHCQL